MRREAADPGVFPGADGVFDPGMDPVGGVDVGVLPPPAFRRLRQVGHPQLVAVAVLVLEQGQFRAGVGPLAAGEDTHRGGPAAELITGRARAQQPGQLGDVRFLDPARPVPAAGVLAGAIGAALADLAAVIERDLPRALGDQAQRGFLPLGQFPPA